MVLRTEIQQNKYCSVIVKLKEFFYVDYRFANYFKSPSRPMSCRTRLSSMFSLSLDFHGFTYKGIAEQIL
jgi:hypothetical protein